MSNELQKLHNPDNLPKEVTTGYQRQNTNIFTIQTGIDTTEPYDDGTGTIIIPAGGIIECNGVMFKIVSEVVLIKPDINTAYWIEVIDNNDDTASFNLVTRPGLWNSEKQGCYTINNNRTLNFVSLGEISDSLGLTYWTQNIRGKWKIQLNTGWYYIDLKSGAGGGDGENGINQTDGGNGGIANVTYTNNAILFSNNSLHNIFVGGNGTNGSDGSDGSDGTYGSGGTYGGGNGGAGGKGGGGGSSAGEATSFDDLTTGIVPAGKGGSGAKGNNGTVGYNNTNGGEGGEGGTGGTICNDGRVGINGKFGGYANGSPGSGGLSNTVFGIGGGYLSGGGGGTGGGGGGGGGIGASGSSAGNGGAGGEGGNGGIANFIDGMTGGYCNIYLLGN